MRQSFDIALPGGEVLSGSLERPATAGPAAAALLCHGFTGHKSEDGRLFVRLARALATDGVASLRFDFRGSGDSDGDFADLTIERELEDARAALDALARAPGIDAAHLALVGLSLGSCVAALLSAERPDLAALVLWAPVAHPGELFRGLGDEPRPGWRVAPGFIESCERATPLAALARYGGPLLCVHGTRDTVVPRAWAEEALTTSRHPASRLELVDGEHTFGADPGKERAIALTRGFLAAALAPRHATR